MAARRQANAAFETDCRRGDAHTSGFKSHRHRHRRSPEIPCKRWDLGAFVLVLTGLVATEWQHPGEFVLVRTGVCVGPSRTRLSRGNAAHRVRQRACCRAASVAPTVSSTRARALRRRCARRAATSKRCRDRRHEAKSTFGSTMLSHALVRKRRGCAGGKTPRALPSIDGERQGANPRGHGPDRTGVRPRS